MVSILTFSLYSIPFILEVADALVVFTRRLPASSMVLSIKDWWVGSAHSPPTSLSLIALLKAVKYQFRKTRFDATFAQRQPLVINPLKP